MKNRFSHVAYTVLGLILCLAIYLSSDLFAGEKPLLSEAIAKAIDTKGVAAATRQFASNYGEDKDKYTVDMQGISELGRKYMEANNFEAVSAVMQIAAPYMQTMVAGTREAQSEAMSEKLTGHGRQEDRKDTKYLERNRQSQASAKVDHEPAQSTPATLSGNAGQTSLIDTDVEYSAISYLDATNPGGGKFRSTLNIHHAPKMIRFENPEKREEPITIFRYDKGVIWLVHPEQRGYEGVKLYQEFKLAKGMGFGSHLDNLMYARQALLSPTGLMDMGNETIEGQNTTHYHKKTRNSGYENGYDIYDYWVSESGILVKMQLTAPEVGYTLETRDIKMGSQVEDLFVPPVDYRKAGHRISWREEKQKLEAAEK